MNGICVALMLGLVASAAAYPYPSKQLRIRQVVVHPAGSSSEPEVADVEVPEPESRFPPFDFGRKVESPKEEDPAEIVEVSDLDEHKGEGVDVKVKEPFIIKPESDSEDEVVHVNGAEEEKKEEEEHKEEEKHEEEEKEKEENEEEKEEKEEHVKAANSKEEEHEADGEDKEKKEKKDDSSSSSSEEKPGEYDGKPDAEKDADIDPLVQAAHYDDKAHGKAELVPKAAPKPQDSKPACGANDNQLRQRVEAIIAELHEIKELCCKLEELESKEAEAY